MKTKCGACSYTRPFVATAKQIYLVRTCYTVRCPAAIFPLPGRRVYRRRCTAVGSRRAYGRSIPVQRGHVLHNLNES